MSQKCLKVGQLFKKLVERSKSMLKEKSDESALT